MTIYLYIKQHSVTGLKYFGKTISKNPFKYLGSGKRWVPHIKKHGVDQVKTLEIWGFDNQEMCTEFALKFSKDNNIVESKEWANLMEENGHWGGSTVKDKIPMNKNGISKRITKDLCEQYEKLGWNYGTGIIPSTSTKNLRSISNKNKITIYNDDKELRVNSDDLESYISAGWEIGRSPIIMEKQSKSQMGRVWINKLGKSTLIYKQNLQKMIEDGWTYGRK